MQYHDVPKMCQFQFCSFSCSNPDAKKNVVAQMHYLLSLWVTWLSQRHCIPECAIFILDLPLAMLRMSRERSRSRSDVSSRSGGRDGLGPSAAPEESLGDEMHGDVPLESPGVVGHGRSSNPPVPGESRAHADPAGASWSRHARMQQVVVHSLLIERWTTLEEVKSQLSLAIMMGEKAAASLAQASRAFKIAVGTQLEENISSNIGNLQTSKAEIDLHLAQVAEAVGDWAARHVNAGLSLPSLPEVDMDVAPPHPHA